MTTGRDPFASYRAELDALGFQPSRRLGQNFLLDPSLHRAIVAVAGPGPADVVVEIGAGLGFLTRELAATGAHVMAVEVDRRLAEVLERRRAGWPAAGGVTLITGDALAGEGFHPDLVAAVRARPSQRLLAIANLPYAVAGPVLALAAHGDLPFDECVVLVQLELAERVVAAPGSSAYGALSAVVRSVFSPALVRRVGRQVFRPRPRVDSAVLHLRPDPGAPLAGTPRRQRAEFARFVRALFGQRRKQLRTALPTALRAAAPAAAGPHATIDPELETRRPEQLSPAELAGLWRATRTQTH